MEIVRSRDKPGNPCNMYGYDEGIQVLDDISTTIGCKPPHWGFATDLPDCLPDNMTTHREILDNGLYQSNQKSLMKPCTTINDLYSDYAYDTSSDSCSEGKETVDITIVYDDLPFKEIIVTQAYDERSLIGDIAGIIGFLFCLDFLAIA